MKQTSIQTDIRKLVRISLGALAMVCLVFVARTGFQNASDKEVLAMQDLLETTFSVETHFLLARRAEKDFLLRKDEKYIGRHAGVMENLSSEIDMVEQGVTQLISGLSSADVDALRLAVDRYDQSFASLVFLNQNLGLDEESGLQGLLRTAVKTAEASLNEFANPVLQAKMLMMRRHEKDFIMRGQQKYVDRLNARVAEFLEFSSSEFPSPLVQSQVNALIVDYQAAFNNFAQLSFEEAESRSAVSASFAEAEPVLQRMKEVIETEAQAVHASAVRIGFIVLAGTFAVVLLMAFMFYRWATAMSHRLAEPWGKTVEVINGLSAGTGDISQLESHYREVSEVATAFGEFQSSILAKERAEQDKREAARAEKARAEEAKRDRRDAELERERAEVARQIAREREVFSEISTVVDACAAGDFSKRLSTDDKDGLMEKICLGLNQIGEAADAGLSDVQGALRAIASGDLSVRMTGRYAGVFRDISEDMNKTAESLAQIVVQLDNSSGSINSSTSALASAATELATRTERTAASLEETAAATEELSESVSSTATTAGQVSADVDGMKTSVDDSIQVVTRTVDAMNGIRDASNEISKITGLIDDIAFQTNLLALNAGVEAARAGSAGKGFAVVATEVRDLAARSADAARDISNLIKQSADQVDKGVRLVDDTGAALAMISEGVEAVVKGVKDIASSAGEQAVTISEITATTSQLDKATQSNAVMFEESAAASKTLQGEAEALAGIVATFKGCATNAKTVAIAVAEEPTDEVAETEEWQRFG